MQNIFCKNVNLQNGFFYKNAGFIFCLDRKKETLSLNAKKLRVSIKDFVIKK